MRGDKAGAERPSLRSQRGLVCPRCRATSELSQEPFEIVRCRADGYALIRAEALADADGDPFLGRTVAGRYVLLGRLGAGSMGTVYRARHEAMGRDVAVKILREGRVAFANAKERFVREARALSMLASPHTVTVYDFGELPVDPEEDELAAGLSLYLAMELLEGESLGERLDRQPRLTIEEAARIARHALLSLAEAHEKGVIHRDLKPDNLFLGRSASGEPHCKLLDFSIAKVMNDPSPRVSALETQEGTVFGTPRYMSPEQAQGRALDARSDLYSMGVLLYQMLAGRPPFTDEDAVVVMAHHIRSLPAPPIEVAPEAGIPRALSDLVLRALAKDPGRRPQSARIFIEELDRAVAEGRGTSGHAGAGLAAGPPSTPSAPSAPKTPRAPSTPSPPSAPSPLSVSPAPARPVSERPARPVSERSARPVSDRPARPVSDRPAPPVSERPEPNSLSSPPPRSLPLPPQRAPGLMPALVGISAIAAGVVGGVFAFSVAHGPRAEAGGAISAEEGGVRAVAAGISMAVQEAREAEEAARREPPEGSGDETGAEKTEGAIMDSEVVGSPGAAPATAEGSAPAQVAPSAASSAPSRAFEVPPPPPQRPRRRFNE